tara:strand:+ start:518 stop:1654 length:1137 start_codon:yes stop_codon:yes gene_type:complete
MPDSSIAPAASAPSKRLVSLDALRGFDMFFIVGGGWIIQNAFEAFDLPLKETLLPQFSHADWGDRITAWDYVFPLFLYMAGVSLFFSVSSALANGTEKKDIYLHAFRRMLVLLVLGIIYKNRSLQFDVESIRFVSVLGRIGVCGFIATLIVCKYKFRAQVIWMFSLLVVYWLGVMFIPVPGYGAGDLSFEGSLIGYLDRMLVPGKLLMGTYDELGFTAHISSTSLVLMGALTAQVLGNDQLSEIEKMKRLSLGGSGCIVLGLIWGLHFPIMKWTWSSSFILVTGGTSVMLLVVFYLLIDYWGFKKWAFFFVVIGMNSLFIYMVSKLIGFGFTTDYLLNPFYELTTNESLQNSMRYLGAFTLKWLLLYFLFRQKIFVKL